MKIFVTVKQVPDTSGKVAVKPDGTLDRAALAKKAFRNHETQALLNSITHPAVIARSRDLLATCRAPLAVIDAPLLFEAGMETLCDITVAVLADPAVRLARIVARDAISEDRARQRMQIQPDDTFYRARADRILINDGDLDDLRMQVADLMTAVKEAMP